MCNSFSPPSPLPLPSPNPLPPLTGPVLFSPLQPWQLTTDANHQTHLPCCQGQSPWQPPPARVTWLSFDHLQPQHCNYSQQRWFQYQQDVWVLHSGGRGGGQDHVHCHLYDVVQTHSTAFLHGRRLLCTFNTSWRVSSMKRLWAYCHYTTTLLCILILSSFIYGMQLHQWVQTCLTCSSV